MPVDLRGVFFRLIRSIWRGTGHVLPLTWRRRLAGSASAGWLRSRIGPTKYAAELGFWRDEYHRTAGRLRDDAYYSTLIRRVGRLDDDDLFNGRIVVDIGCGPRGSLCWILNARLCVGIDPLADAYRQLGISAHPMAYVAALGEALPIRNAAADLVITINALDHVDDPVQTMREIRRILRPGGCFIGSINLRERPTGTEPGVITRERVDAHLLRGWAIEYAHVFPECDVPNDAYRYADSPPPAGFVPEMNILWCRARRPGD